VLEFYVGWRQKCQTVAEHYNLRFLRKSYQGCLAQPGFTQR